MQSLAFFAIGHAMHQLLPRAYHQAFSQGPYIPGETGLRASSVTAQLGREFADLEVDGSIFQHQGPRAAEGEGIPEEDEDARARAKAELARTRRVMQQFMTSNFGAEVHVMRLALDGEARLMRKLLHSIGAEAERKQMHAAFEGRGWLTRVSSWLDVSLLEEFFTLSWHYANDASCWAHLHETESMRSRICTVLMRAVATGHELLSIAVATPFRLFALVETQDPAQQLAIAEEVFATRKCLLDVFTASHLARYGCAEQLLSPASLETLRCLAWLAQTATFTTERLHSQNLRKAKKPMTHKPALATLALQHMCWAGPAVLRSQEKSDVGNKDKRPRGRPSMKTAQAAAEEAGSLPARTGGGGSWRAFQSVMLGGQKFSAAAVKDLAAIGPPSTDLCQWRREADFNSLANKE